MCFAYVLRLFGILIMTNQLNVYLLNVPMNYQFYLKLRIFKHIKIMYVRNVLILIVMICVFVGNIGEA